MANAAISAGSSDKSIFTNPGIMNGIEKSKNINTNANPESIAVTVINRTLLTVALPFHTL
jgi:hypothetical protein